MSKIQRLAELIARYEGFYVTAQDAAARGIAYPTIPQRTNNPGDLMYAGQPGAVAESVVGHDKKVREYARFQTVEQGWEALIHQISLDAERGLTLWQFIQKYAPASDANDPKSYFAFVAKELDASPKTPLSQVIECQ